MIVDALRDDQLEHSLIVESRFLLSPKFLAGLSRDSLIDPLDLPVIINDTSSVPREHHSRWCGTG